MRRVVRDRDRAGRAVRAREAVEILEGRQTRAGIALRPRRPLRPGWSLRPCRPGRACRPGGACRTLGACRALVACWTLRPRLSLRALSADRAGVALGPLLSRRAGGTDRALDVPRERELPPGALRWIGDHPQQAGDLLLARLDDGTVRHVGRGQRGDRACTCECGENQRKREQPGTRDTRDLGH